MQKSTDSAVRNDLGIVRTISVRKSPLFPNSRAGKNLQKRRKFYENRTYEKAEGVLLTNSKKATSIASIAEQLAITTAKWMQKASIS